MNHPYRTPGVVEKYEEIEPEPHPGGLPCPANKSALPIKLIEASKWSYPRNKSWSQRLADAGMLEYSYKNGHVAICLHHFSWVFKSTWAMERELDKLYSELRNK